MIVSYDITLVFFYDSEQAFLHQINSKNKQPQEFLKNNCS